MLYRRIANGVMDPVLGGKVQLVDLVDFYLLVADNAKYKRALACSLRALYI